MDDHSTDRDLGNSHRARRAKFPEAAPSAERPARGFGRAIVAGLDASAGDAVVIMMADESDDCRDVVRYWEKLNEGYDCVFGSRFMKGGGVIDYPRAQTAASIASPTSFSACSFASR